MKKPIYILLSLACISCGIVDFSPSDSIKVNPSKYNQIVGEDEEVYVKFGFSPDHVSAQSAFEIQNMDGRIGGSFRWERNTMLFSPQECLEPAQRYMLKFAGEVADTSGKLHRYNIYTPFFYRTRQTLKPDVTKMNPDAGSTINAYDKIIFSFSAPMSLPSFLDGLSVSPEIEYSEEWNAEHTQMILTPRNGWKEHQVYSFSFSDSIKSADGIPLVEQRTFSLYSSSGESLPAVLSAHTALNDGLSYPILLSGLEGVKNKDAIRITFSVPMDTETVESALSISPDIAGHTCWLDESTLIFVPEAEWQGETVYSLVIDTSAESRKGLFLPDCFEAVFSPDDTPLKLLYLEGKDADGFPVSVFNPHQEIDIDAGDALLPERTYTFGFVFNHAFDTAEAKEQVYSGIKLKGIFPPSLVSPKVVSQFWSGDSRVQITYTGFEPEGRIYSLDVNGLEKIVLRTR